MVGKLAPVGKNAGPERPGRIGDYCEPLITLDLESSGFPGGKKKDEDKIDPFLEFFVGLIPENTDKTRFRLRFLYGFLRFFVIFFYATLGLSKARKGLGLGFRQGVMVTVIIISGGGLKVGDACDPRPHPLGREADGGAATRP